MKKLWKYIVGFFTIVIGGLLAFLSGRSAGKRDERIKDIKKDLKTTSATIKKTLKKSDAYKKTLASKQKALEEIKKQQKQFNVERTSADEAADFLKKYVKNKK